MSLGVCGCDPADVRVGLPERYTAVVGDAAGQHTLLCQRALVRVPAENRGDDGVLVIPPAGDKEFITACGKPATCPLAAQLGDQRPHIRARTVAEQRLHRPAYTRERERCVSKAVDGETDRVREWKDRGMYDTEVETVSKGAEVGSPTT